MAEQRISYTGERIDVGIDVHKETYTVTCLWQRQMVKALTVLYAREDLALGRAIALQLIRDDHARYVG